jgi:hypothetical protein
MKHKWMKEQLHEEEFLMVDNRKSVYFSSDRGVTFKKFMAMEKLKKALLAEIAANLTQKEIGTLHDLFDQIDKDRDGTMTLTDLDEALAHGMSALLWYMCLLLSHA